MPDNSHLHTPNLLAFEILRLTTPSSSHIGDSSWQQLYVRLLRREPALLCNQSFSSLIALPLAIFVLSSAHSGMLGNQSVPGLLSTKG